MGCRVDGQAARAWPVPYCDPGDVWTRIIMEKNHTLLDQPQSFVLDDPALDSYCLTIHIRVVHFVDENGRDDRVFRSWSRVINQTLTVCTKTSTPFPTDLSDSLPRIRSPSGDE
ncbi:hypothetical protein TNCV_1961811 [Trichonephila clavipes]|nr:hypothetical protein TNCV_1961811 [Trichonephila clavipes]